jgi:ribosomal protein S18 acetylase RimI-like enzyme
MTETPKIRRATEHDVDAIVGLHARSWQVAYRGLVPDEMIDRVVSERAVRAERIRAVVTDADGPRRAWVIVDRGVVVGFSIVGPSRDPDAADDTGEVHTIYLHPDALGKGIGRALFERVTRDLRDQGFARAMLWVLEANARARRFYEAAGWAFDGTIRDDVRPAGIVRNARYRRDLRAG